MEHELTGTVFDIKELSVYDGPGVRTTVFLKGCPLRCAWCHNPEGLSPTPQIMVNHNSCVGCGNCQTVKGCAKFFNNDSKTDVGSTTDNNSTSGGKCIGCGRCVEVCRGFCRTISGRVMTVDELCGRILRCADIYPPDGGVTFSGGEPTMQGDFLTAVMDKLRELDKDLSIAMQTCGYASHETFMAACERCGLVFFDIKLVDSAAHRVWTGVSNAPILKNLEWLKTSDIPFIARIPLIPGVTDTEDNLRAACELLIGAKNLLRVELMPYNMAAGAKYRMAEMTYSPGFEEKPPTARIECFAKLQVETKVL